MATYDELMAAARKADEMGDAEGARRLLEMAIAAKGSGPSLPPGITPDAMALYNQQRDMDALMGSSAGVKAVTEGVAAPEIDMGKISEANMRDQGHGGAGDTGAMGLLNGLTFGLADEGVGAMRAAGSLFTDQSMADAYKEGRDNTRAVMGIGKEEHPWIGLGSEVAGAVASPVSLLNLPKIAKAGSTVKRIGAGAGIGAGQGALFGYNNAEGGVGGRASGAAMGGFFGLGAGAALPALGAAWSAGPGKWARQAAENKRFVGAAPDNDKLRGLAKEAFSIADEAAPFSREAFADWAEELANKARGAGMRPKVTPAARSLLDEILEEANLAKSPKISFGSLDELRAVAGNVAGKTGDKGEQGLGMLMKNAIDDFVENNPDVSKAAKLGRRLWRQMRNSEMIDDAMEKAKLNASGFENGLRIQFRNILNKDVGKNRLPKGLKSAMEEVVQGTTGGNWFRKVARMASVGSGQQTNMLGAGLSATGGATLGSMLGGPVGGVVGGMLPAIAGRGAGALAEKSTLNAANRARAVAAMGRIPNKVPAIDHARPIGLLERLIGAGAIPTTQ